MFEENNDDYPKIPLYDIDFLETWYKGPVCLAGDAAHPTSPHVGQGASMALEDSITLAKCLRDIKDTQQAFARVIESSRAIEAPWPTWGDVGCAASPAKQTGPLCQVSRKLISYTGIFG